MSSISTRDIHLATTWVKKKKLVEKKKAEKGKNESVLSEDVLIILLMLEALTFLFCFFEGCCF